jgi:hypothetical protein
MRRLVGNMNGILVKLFSLQNITKVVSMVGTQMVIVVILESTKDISLE